jgi:eukaryotic-like serine/threonine-protein kinase
MTTSPTPAIAGTNPSPVQVGQVLVDKYRVERILGAGGMGVVVAAHHLQLHLEVAIKFLRGAALLDGEAVARFQREARAAVKLKSEHVARVLDVGTLESGSPFMVMELLDGLDLGTLVETGDRIATGDAVDYVLQASEAIAEAHSLGIVHRDIKPRNLFLTSRVDGRPLIKVLDFGISKVLEGAGDGRNITLTSTTDIVGSPSYMSPEQLRSARSVDERTDIWSLGVVLYELLTGKLPFGGENVMSIVLTIAQEGPAPISGVRPDVPPALEAAVMRCLEKDKALRFQSVGELAHAIEAFAAPQTSGVGERIAKVRSSARRTSVPARSSARVVVSGGTSVSWGQTELGPTLASIPPTPSRTKWHVGVALATVTASAIVVWGVLRRDPPAPPQPSPAASAVDTAAEMPRTRKDDSPEAGALAATADPPTSTPTARKLYPRPASAVPVAATGPLAPPRPIPTGTATVTSSPKPEAPSNDMPAERK